jgi:hypothetical protein
MNRMAGQPRKPPPVTAAPLPEVIPDEPCDRCGAPARHRVRVVYRSGGLPHRGQLLFCGHHFQVHEPALLVSTSIWSTAG